MTGPSRSGEPASGRLNRAHAERRRIRRVPITPAHNRQPVRPPCRLFWRVAGTVGANHHDECSLGPGRSRGRRWAVCVGRRQVANTQDQSDPPTPPTSATNPTARRPALPRQNFGGISTSGGGRHRDRPIDRWRQGGAGSLGAVLPAEPAGATDVKGGAGHVVRRHYVLPSRSRIICLSQSCPNWGPLLIRHGSCQGALWQVVRLISVHSACLRTFAR